MRHPNRSSAQKLKYPRNRDVSLSSAGPDLVGDDLVAVGLQVAAHTVGALSPGVLTAKKATSAEWDPNGRLQRQDYRERDQVRSQCCIVARLDSPSAIVVR
ncbi:MAG: hypothetical protein QOE30_1534 [Mycobacterium sp.]|jgi:hypothetical protein|nr:hypothetical protein [Mycobacterium sp.]